MLKNNFFFDSLDDNLKKYLLPKNDSIIHVRDLDRLKMIL